MNVYEQTDKEYFEPVKQKRKFLLKRKIFTQIEQIIVIIEYCTYGSRNYAARETSLKTSVWNHLFPLYQHNNCLNYFVCDDEMKHWIIILKLVVMVVRCMMMMMVIP